MDLIKVVFFIFILERRFLLEMYVDFFVYLDLFVKYVFFTFNIIILVMKLYRKFKFNLSNDSKKNLEYELGIELLINRDKEYI